MNKVDENKLLPETCLEQVAECLRVMGHPLRLRLVDLMLSGEYTVNELAELCGAPPSQTCEHLRLMKSHGYLACRREGRKVYYLVNDPQLPDLIACIRRHSDCPGKNNKGA